MAVWNFCIYYGILFSLLLQAAGILLTESGKSPLEKAMKKTSEKKSAKSKRPASAHRIRRILILSYLVITLVAVAAISIPVLLLSSNALKNKVTSLLHTYTSQLVPNSDTYLSDYASPTLLLFSDSSALQYDPDDAKRDGKQAEQYAAAHPCDEKLW